jgi:hypothetical protein
MQKHEVDWGMGSEVLATQGHKIHSGLSHIGVGPWDDSWGKFQDDAVMLAVTVDIGDNFVVNAAKGNSEGCDF